MRSCPMFFALFLFSACSDSSTTPETPPPTIGSSETFDVSTASTETIAELHDKFNERSEYGANLAALNQTQETLLLVCIFEAEVNNGGISQFFWNSSGNYAQETLDALTEIGAHETVQLLTKALELWPDQIAPKDRTARNKIQALLTPEQEAEWETIDKALYDYPDNLEALLSAFWNAR